MLKITMLKKLNMLEIKPIFHSLCRSKIGAILLLIQIVITTAIVSNAAFIIQDRISYLTQETGYPEQEIFQFNIMTFGKDIDIKQQLALDETMLRALPEVIDATWSSAMPLSGGGMSSDFSLKPAPEDSLSVRTGYFFADEHIVNTLGVKLIAGRNFTEDDVVIKHDNKTIPNVIIVSNHLVKDLFSDDEGLGKTIYFGEKSFKIIGIIEKMKGAWLKDSKPDNVALIPFVDPKILSKIIVRTKPGQRTSVMKNIEDIMLNAYDKRVINSVIGMDTLKADYVAQDRLMMRMLVVLISILVLVTALGIFGLTLFNISKRTKQIGTRRALGARKSAIVSYFLVENAMVCSLGIILGAVAAILLGRNLMEYFSVPALDIRYIIGTALMIILMSLLSVLVPAIRAANISPSIATRTI